MRKKRRRAPAFIVFLLFSSSCYATELSFKISGGPSFLNLGDINHALEDWAGWRRKEAHLNQNWSFEGGRVEKFRTGFNFECEILVSFFGGHAGLGLCSGYMDSSLQEEKTELTIRKGTTTFVYVRPTKVSSYPLGLSAYYFFPVAKKTRLYLKAGMGLIWAKYIEREGSRKSTDLKFSYPSSQMAKARDLTFQGGIGLNFQFEPNLSFFLEGSAARAKIDDFQGETKAGEKGTLFLFEEYNQNIDFWQTKIQIMTQEPGGEQFRSVREATVDFSGFSIKIGLQFKF